jgi:DNA-binding transcriptional regulator YiaG
MNAEVLDQALARARKRQRLPSPAQRKQIREATGVSPRDIAKALGVSECAVRHWETGRRNPRGVRLDGYLQVLECLNDAVNGTVF